MTPAATAAARNRTERRTVDPSGPAPRTPRRVSGPVSGLAPARGGPAPLPAPARRAPTPRPAPARVPAPVRTPAPARRRSTPARRPATPHQRQRIGLSRQLSPTALLRSLSGHRLLDRLIRGRAWIPVVGVLLAGIVAMRVEVLKLGVSVGRSTALASQLESENQTLRANVASLSNAARIEHLAATMGMALPGPLDLHFVSASSGRDLGRAAAGIASPDPTTFESGLATQIAAHSSSISAVAPSTAVPSGGSSSSVPPATSSVAPATGSVPPATGSVPPATGAVAPATGAVAPATSAGSTAAPASTATGAPLG